MNRILDMFGAFAAEMDKHPSSKSSKLRSSKRQARSGKANDRGPLHFSDPDAAESRESSTDDLGLPQLKQKQAETWARIEELEAPLAREMKRWEQLQKRRENYVARKKKRRKQQDEEPFLTPRAKNRRAYERELARVERDALNAKEALDRRFAQSDKLLELKVARQATELNNEQRQREAVPSEVRQQHHNGGSFEAEAQSSPSAEQLQREVERREREYQPQDDRISEISSLSGRPNVQNGIPGQLGGGKPGQYWTASNDMRICGFEEGIVDQRCQLSE